MNKQRIELKVEKLSFIAQNHEKAWEKGSLDLMNIAIKRGKLRWRRKFPSQDDARPVTDAPACNKIVDAVTKTIRVE